MKDQRWAEFWKNQTQPLYRYDEEWHYAEHADELKLLLPADISNLSVFEIGCGNGAFYELLNFHECSDYFGIDISESMLNAFRKRHPKIEVQCCNAESFTSADRKFDIIFSNQLLQFIDHEQFDELLKNSKQHLKENGSIYLLSVPWKRMRNAYLTGRVPGRTKLGLIQAFRKLVQNLSVDDLGNWYDFEDVDCLAAKHGFQATYYGSLHYIYRFHFVLSAMD